MSTKREREIMARGLPPAEEKYLLALAEAVKILPARPPTDWTERTFAEAHTWAKIIKMRLAWCARARP